MAARIDVSSPRTYQQTEDEGENIHTIRNIKCTENFGRFIALRRVVRQCCRIKSVSAEDSY